MIYKEVDLFGNETPVIYSRKKQSKSLFDDYDGFLDKFEEKKTTDDCYTPQEVYNIILQHVGKSFDMHNKKILRPFSLAETMKA